MILRAGPFSEDSKCQPPDEFVRSVEGVGDDDDEEDWPFDH